MLALCPKSVESPSELPTIIGPCPCKNSCGGALVRYSWGGERQLCLGSRAGLRFLVDQSPLSRAGRILLRALIELTPPGHTGCFPSNLRICQQAAYKSEQSVRNVRRELVELGLVRWRERRQASGRQTSNLYEINRHKLLDLVLKTPVPVPGWANQPQETSWRGQPDRDPLAWDQPPTADHEAKTAEIDVSTTDISPPPSAPPSGRILEPEAVPAPVIDAEPEGGAAGAPDTNACPSRDLVSGGQTTGGIAAAALGVDIEGVEAAEAPVAEVAEAFVAGEATASEAFVADEAPASEALVTGEAPVVEEGELCGSSSGESKHASSVGAWILSREQVALDWRRHYRLRYSIGYPVFTERDELALVALARTTTIVATEMSAEGQPPSVVAQQFLDHVFSAFLREPGHRDFLVRRAHALPLLLEDLPKIQRTFRLKPALKRVPEKAPALLPSTPGAEPMSPQQMAEKMRQTREILEKSRRLGRVVPRPNFFAQPRVTQAERTTPADPDDGGEAG